MTRWSDDRFLDNLRRQGDPLADRAVARLIETGGISAVNAIFPLLRDDECPLPPDLPAPLGEFLAQTGQLPAGVDLARVRRGEEAFMRHAFTSALVLLAKSLPEGYAAPCLAKILHLSGDLERSPYRRLLGVLQMVIRVCSVRGFEPDGKVVVTAQKMRLLHAGVRTLVPRYLPDYRERFGLPVNLEDMLGTIMGFSYLVVTGLQQLEVGLGDEDAEDLYYLWQVFARMCGIHPDGQPDSAEYVPQNLAEAGELYAAYARRHYTAAAANPEGVVLARDNLKMLRDLLPRLLRWLGFGMVPHIYMQDLIGRAGCARVGIRPVYGLWLTKWLLLRGLGLWNRAIETQPRKPVEAFAQLLFQGMINRQYGGQVQFLIPDSMAGLHRLA